MSKSSLRNQKTAKKEEVTQKLEAQNKTEGQSTMKTVNPVKVGSQKGKTVPKTRKPLVTKDGSNASGEASEAKKAKEPARTGVPEWLDSYLKYQSEFTKQLGDQIIQDHRILEDHEWRLHDLEKHVGLEPKPAEPVKKVEPEDSKKNEPEDPKKNEPEDPKKELVSQTDPTEPILDDLKPKAKEPEVEVESEGEKASDPEDMIPREMYEAKVFEGGKWRLRGPFKRISQASQATHGDLSKVNIVNVWYNPEHDVTLGYMTAEEMERYL